MRAANPSLTDIGFYAPHDGRGLFLRVEYNAFALMQDDKYEPWRCLNDRYVVTDSEISQSFIGPTAELTLKGVYDLKKIANQYAALSGIIDASSAIGGGDGPTICLASEGERWFYTFDQAGGDCPAGCTEHSYTLFSTAAPGTITSLGTPSAAQLAKYATFSDCHSL